MSIELEKRAIRQAFGRASERYDGVAQVQRKIADTLLSTVRDLLPQTALDAGCGTGYAARQLAQHFGQAHIVTLDCSHEMAACAKFSGVVGDIECLPLSGGCVDLYFSSLAWQWTDPQTAIGEAHRVLSPGGNLRVATLASDSLHELKEAFAAVDDAVHVRRFHDSAAFAPWLAQAGFVDVGVSRDRLVVHASDVVQVMNGLRDLGAHVVGPQRRKGLLGRGSWQRLIAQYEKRRVSRGLPITYDVVYLSATKAAL